MEYITLSTHSSMYGKEGKVPQCVRVVSCVCVCAGAFARKRARVCECARARVRTCVHVCARIVILEQLVIKT